MYLRGDVWNTPDTGCKFSSEVKTETSLSSRRHLQSHTFVVRLFNDFWRKFIKFIIFIVCQYVISFHSIFHNNSFHIISCHIYTPFSTDFHFNFVQLPTSSRKLWLFHATPNIDQLPRPRLGWNLRVRQSDFEKNYVAVSVTSHDPWTKYYSSQNALESSCS